MKENKYVLGLDLGTGSVGWSCVLYNEENEPYRILDLGSRIFDVEGASMEDRRIARGTRRVLRRRKARVSRTKNLFVRYQYLSQEQIKNMFCHKGSKQANPYELRIKGKQDELSFEELCVVLVHYSKGRGFRSNRKKLEEDVKESASATDEQKLLFAKRKTEDTLVKMKEENPNYTITNLLMDQVKVSGRVRNTSGIYSIGITRKMIEEEVTLILDCQISKGVITEKFKEEYLEILLHQRTFSEGPDEPSIYHNPLQKMIGRCRFIEESRAAKAAPSYELFTLVQKLHDLRYSVPKSNDKQKLSTQQIAKLIELALLSNTITYKVVRQVIGMDVDFVGLQVPKKAYVELVDKMKANPELDRNKEMEIAKGKVEIYKLKGYAKLKKIVKDTFGSDYSISIEQLDLIADCLSRCKSDGEISQYLQGEREVLTQVTLPEEVKDLVMQMDDQGFKEFGKISFSFLYQILPLMMNEGLDYTEACAKCGYHHSKMKTNDTDFNQLPVIEQILDELEQTVTNKAVIRTLVESRKVVNAVVREYGKPLAIHVEMARELTKSADERKKLQNQQFDNQAANASLKYQIYSKHPDKFRSVFDVGSQDVIQYKLYIEQKGICPYTLLKTGDESAARIPERDLFTYDVEIDHIIPYSLCFDNRMENKVLVKKQENQEKANRTPLQYYHNALGLNKYKSWVKGNPDITVEKESRFLADKVNDQLMNDYRARTINDTRYAAKAFKEILTYSFPSVKIRSFTGQIPAKLRGVYRLNGLTHSWQSKDYKKREKENLELEELYAKLSELILHHVSKKSKEYITVLRDIRKVVNNEEIKNRENHLHHALDATIIAIATDKVRRKIEIHEMILRQKKTKEIVVETPIFDENTAECIGYKKEVVDLEKYKQGLQENESIEKALFPQPYPCFREEVVYRVYELDKQRLHEQLSDLPQYRGVQLSEIKPLFISHHFESKVSGKLHAATYYGMKEAEEGRILTSRMAINTEKFDKKKLEKLYDIEGTQSYIYSAVKEWLDGYANGLKAYEGHLKQYPKNRNGNEIKKIKLNEGLIKEEIELHEGSKQFVAKDNVVQVRIYRRAGDNKLYFVGMDRFRLLNEKKRKDLDLLLWWAQGKSNICIKEACLKKEGFIEAPQTLYKGQIVLVELKSGASGLAKVVGFTSGMFEVESIYGDAQDLFYNHLFVNFRTQYSLTVSTIKSVKSISVSVLGKIKS